MPFNLKGILIIALTISTLQLAVLQHPSKIDQNLLEKDHLLQVVHLAHSENQQLSQKYFKVEILDKTKIAVSFKLRRIESKIVKLLKKYSLVQNSHQLIKARLKPEFISSKRKWSLKVIFAVCGNQQTLQKVVKRFGRMGIMPLQNVRYSRYLQEKIQVLKLFKGAQIRVIRALRQLGRYRLIDVEKIEIIGQLQNSAILQNQIENQFSDSIEDIQQSKISYNQTRFKNGEGKGIKIIFKVQQLLSPDQTQEDSLYDEDDVESEESDNQSSSDL